MTRATTLPRYQTPRGGMVLAVVYPDGSALCAPVGKLWPGYNSKPRMIDAATFATFQECAP